MRLRTVIRWIDRQWDEFPNASNWLGLIVAAGRLPLLIFGRSEVTSEIAVLWAAVWIAFFGWRFLAQIK